MMTMSHMRPNDLRVASSNAAGIFAKWLVAHNTRVAHHWDNSSYALSVERESRIAEEILDSRVESAADVAAIILATTAFGEFSMPDKAFAILDGIARGAFAHQSRPQSRNLPTTA